MERRKIKPNDRSLTGSIVSSKNEGQVNFESSLERDYLIILEFDDNVESYIEQPLGIEYISDNGIRKIYTPDVLVTFKKGTNLKPWLCELKYRQDLRENFSIYKTKFKAAKKYAAEKGWEFCLIDESIRGNLLNNAKFLLNFKDREFNSAIKDDVLEVLIKIQKEKNSFTHRSFREEFGQSFEVKAIGVAEYWRLVWNKTILFDYNEKISLDTEMWLNEIYYGDY